MNIVSIATQGLKDSWVRLFQLYYKKNTGIWHKIVLNGKGMVSCKSSRSALYIYKIIHSNFVGCQCERILFYNFIQ